MTSPKEPVIIALGSNLPYGSRSRLQSLCDALDAMTGQCIRVLDRSPWYRSRPVPTSGQPDFINGVALVETDLDPDQLLHQLHAVEKMFGRRRRTRNEARTIDLDLIAYGDVGPCAIERWPGPAAPSGAFACLRVVADARCRSGMAPPCHRP